MNPKKIRAAKILSSEIILVIMTILVLTPVYYFMIGSFKSRENIVMYPLTINGSMFSFNNYVYVWDKMKIASAIMNNLIITVGSLAITVVVSSLAGFSLARIKGRLFAFAGKYVVVLMVVPFISCLLMLVQISTELQLYNTLLGCMLIHTAWHLPFCTFLYSGFMQSIPQDLEEAAYIDGCSTARTYWNIFLPLLTPVTATCCIRSGITIWNDYLVSKTMLNPVRTPTLMVSISSFFGDYVSEYGYAFAGIVISSLPIIILFVFLQKYFIKGLTAGAVKG